ncbi:MAG: prepilin-type N-terminal cleavage/methylation domain-containing protein [Methylotenera sp.]
MIRKPSSQHGVTLIELVLAVAISAILMGALNGLVKLGLDAQIAGRGANELAYQGRFALERMTDKARVLPPRNLTTTPAANTTGYWFSITDTSCVSTSSCVMYCRNASSNQLIETTTSDTACTGTTVIASNVSAFTATLPTNMGAVDRSIVVISLTLSDANNNTASFSTSIRLGGGSL